MKSVVVYSGGQDSTTCLISELDIGYDVTAISFDYGQQHDVELEAASNICDLLGVEHKVVKIQLPDMNSALLKSEETLDVLDASPIDTELPASFVPGRNAMFLSIAYGYAMAIGAERIVTGVCETDYSGYPDCRQLFIERLQRALQYAYGKGEIVTPLMNKTKAETFAMAYATDGLLFALCSRTCYRGHTNEHPYPWGHGCNDCPSCEIRKDGWIQFLDGLPGEVLSKVERLSRYFMEHGENCVPVYGSHILGSPIA